MLSQGHPVLFFMSTLLLYVIMLRARNILAIGLLTTLVCTATSAQAADAASVVETAKQYTATVDAQVGSWSVVWRAKLVEKERELSASIAAAKEKEEAVEHSAVGTQINAVAGGDVAKPSRPLGTPTDTLKRVGLQLYRLLVLIAIYILDHKILLYILAALVLYKVIRILFAIAFTRRV